MRAAALLSLVSLLACDSTSQGTGGAGGSNSTTSAASVTAGQSSVVVGSSSGSSTSVSSTSSGMCVPQACPPGACGNYPDGCGSTSPCADCGLGNECVARVCMPCADPSTCESCYPSAQQQQDACLAHSPKALCFSAFITKPGCKTMFWLDCDYDNAAPPASDCGVQPDRFCRDYFADVPCAGSKLPVN